MYLNYKKLLPTNLKMSDTLTLCILIIYMSTVKKNLYSQPL